MTLSTQELYIEEISLHLNLPQTKHIPMQILELQLFLIPQTSFTYSVSSEKGGSGAATCPREKEACTFALALAISSNFL